MFFLQFLTTHHPPPIVLHYIAFWSYSLLSAAFFLLAIWLMSSPVLAGLLAGVLAGVLAVQPWC